VYKTNKNVHKPSHNICACVLKQRKSSTIQFNPRHSDKQPKHKHIKLTSSKHHRPAKLIFTWRNPKQQTTKQKNDYDIQYEAQDKQTEIQLHHCKHTSPFSGDVLYYYLLIACPLVLLQLVVVQLLHPLLSYSV